MKGFKPTMKMAHGGKVRHFVEGGLSNKMGPPDNSERGGRRYGEGEAAQNARAKAKSKSAVRSAANAIKEIDPELGYVGNVRNIVKKQYDMMDAFRESDKASSETGYKRGGKVRRYAEGSEGGVKSEDDALPNLKKRRTLSDIMEGAREYYMGPKKSKKGKYVPPDTSESDTQIRKMIDSGEYKKGGKVRHYAEGSDGGVKADDKLVLPDKIKIIKSDDQKRYERERNKQVKMSPWLRLQKAKGGKVEKVMREFKAGELHSGKKGPVVKSRKQAIAIALSEAGKSKKG